MYGQMGGTPRERARTGRGGKAHNELALPTAKTNALCLHDLACTMTDMYSAVDDVTFFPTCFDSVMTDMYVWKCLFAVIIKTVHIDAGRTRSVAQRGG